LHSTLKARAAREGMSLSDFIKRELGRIAERPSMADALKRDLSQRDDSFIVPHLLDVEAASGLRLLVAGQRVDSHRMEQLLAGLATLPAERYAHAPLLPRIWELRHNFTCYDAAYIALAEATDSVL
jgi:predicted nucleic acid-binding protein